MATVGGFALVLHLPLHGGLRALIAALWVVQSAREIRRMAWIRIRLADGRKYGELLRGNAVIDKQWHRLQLIWQQTRQNIGRSA